MTGIKTKGDRIVVPTSEGDAEAVREGSETAWEIGYPWGDDRFHGSRVEVRARMRARIAEEEATVNH